MKPKAPPRLPEMLLRVCLQRSLPAEMIRADLREEFFLRVDTHSRGAASGWYWRQALDVAVRIAARRMRHRLSPRRATPSPEPESPHPGVVMKDLVQDLQYALRSTRKAPGFAVVVVLTLALGVGANTTIFSLINEVMLRPLPIADESRVVRLYTSDFSSGVFGTSSYPDYVSFREQSTQIDDLAAFSFGTPFNIGSSGVANRVSGILVTGNYFDVLGVKPSVGRLLQPGDDVTPGGHPVVVLGHGLWNRLFGKRNDIVGQTILLNGSSFTVIGVTNQDFTGLQIGATPDLYIPVTMFAIAYPRFASFKVLELRGGRWLSTVARLRDGATIETAQSEITAIMARLATEFPSNMGTADRPDEPRPVTLLPVRDAALGAARIGATAARAGLLLSVVGLVLLIACANIANLLLARGTRRQREIGVRLAIGASRRRIVRQLMTESVALGLVGGGVGVAVAAVLMKFLVPLGLPSVLQGSLTLPDLSIDGAVLAFAAALSLGTSMVFGVLPALRASRPDLVTALKNSELTVGRRGTRFGSRDALVVAQVAGSLVLLVAAGLFIQNARSMYRTDLGFTVDGVSIVSLDVARQGMDPVQGQAFFDRLLERVDGLPGVQSAAYASYAPVNPGGTRASFTVEGMDVTAAGAPEFNLNNVSPRYFETLGIPLVRGRGFSASDDDGAPSVVIVNTTFAKAHWPGESALGKRVFNTAQTPTEFEVIGVVETNKYRAVREDPLPYLYFPISQAYQSTVTLAIRSSTDGNFERLVPAVRSAVLELDPGMPVFNARTLRQQLGVVLAQERSIAILIGVLGALALSLAALGIYGVMAYLVAQRTKEIGVRSALGARGIDVVRMVLGRSLTLSVIGIGVGTVVSLMVSSAYKGFVSEVNPTNPVTFALVALALTVVGLLASVVPAMRAAQVEPLTALRAE